ncbi:hypothetical protein GF337_10940, partial [candidate division KSB1 bacterium]|nr:hypothetical protein [candidate division KSB1 bacterium]
MNHRNEVNIDPTWQGLIKWGGISLVIASIIVIIFIVGVGVFHVTLPLDPATVLERPNVPTTLFIITIFGEFLLLPGFLALYFVLRKVDKAKMFIAAVLGAFSVVMFFVSRALIISLSQVSAGYKSAATDSGKAAYLAAAEVALETQNVYSTIALIFLSLASI